MFSRTLHIFFFLLHFSCENLVDSLDVHFSNIVSDTMKINMRNILNKHRNGILCNDFMDIYNVSILKFKNEKFSTKYCYKCYHMY